jgi:hypothetical protein
MGNPKTVYRKIGCPNSFFEIKLPLLKRISNSYNIVSNNDEMMWEKRLELKFEGVSVERWGCKMRKKISLIRFLQLNR